MTGKIESPLFTFDDARVKVTVYFPREYKNWHIIINAGEQFLKIYGYVGFLTPAFVNDFRFVPEISEERRNAFIEHILLTLQNIDIQTNGKSSI